MPRSRYNCHWLDCDKFFDNAELLFDHLCDEHIGRKSTNNLCLICCWNNCGTKAAKRDHLTSHLKVHLPLKPHRCPTCKKAFKRPQDLKKHERIHTIEHQASLLSNQPGYKPVRRRRNTQQKQQQTTNTAINVTQMSKPTITMTAPSNNNSISTAYTTKDDDTDPGYFSEMLTGSSPSSYRASTNSPSSYHPTTETEFDDDDDDDYDDKEQEQVNHFINQHNYNKMAFEVESPADLAYEPMTTAVAGVGTTTTTTSITTNTPEYIINNNALQSLFYDAIQSKTLSPEYDTEMMERLDNVSHELQRQSENWKPSVNDPNDINALQDWLEQLSANIQTDACLYPEIITSPPSSQLGSTTTMPSNPNLDSELYSNFDMNNSNKQQQFQHHSIEASPNAIPDWKAMMMAYSENPLAASILNQHTAKLPASLHSENTASSNENAPSTLGASFWTPGNSADVDILPMEDSNDAVPSEAIEFESPPPTVYTKPQPLHLFESTKETSDMAAAKQNIQTSSSYNDKRSMMHMMNAFTAPGPKQTRTTTIVNSTASSEDKEEKESTPSPSTIPLDEGANEKATVENIQETNDHHETNSKENLDEDNNISKPYVSTASGTTMEKKQHISRHSINQLLFGQIVTDEKPSLSTHIKKSKEGSKNNDSNNAGSSPYAEVTDKLRDLTVNDTTSAEQAARERHAAIVNRLWDSVLRIKQQDEQNKNKTVEKPLSLSLSLLPLSASRAMSGTAPKVTTDSYRKNSSSKPHDTVRHYQQDPRNQLVSV